MKIYEEDQHSVIENSMKIDSFLVIVVSDFYGRHTAAASAKVRSIFVFSFQPVISSSLQSDNFLLIGQIKFIPVSIGRIIPMVFEIIFSGKVTAEVSRHLICSRQVQMVSLIKSILAPIDPDLLQIRVSIQIIHAFFFSELYDPVVA